VLQPNAAGVIWAKSGTDSYQSVNEIVHEGENASADGGVVETILDVCHPAVFSKYQSVRDTVQHV